MFALPALNLPWSCPHERPKASVGMSPGGKMHTTLSNSSGFHSGKLSTICSLSGGGKKNPFWFGPVTSTTGSGNTNSVVANFRCPPV
jgi:hypothetical protein